MYHINTLSGLSGFDDAIETIWKRVNWNTGSAECRASMTCPAKDTVKRVLESYNGLAKSGKVPIYNQANGLQVATTINASIGIDKGTIGAILLELYNATLSNAVDSTEYLSPPGAKASLETKATTANPSADPGANPNVIDGSELQPEEPLWKNPWVLGAAASVVGTAFIVWRAKRGQVRRPAAPSMSDQVSERGAAELSYEVTDGGIIIRGPQDTSVRTVTLTTASGEGAYNTSTKAINLLSLRSYLIGQGDLQPRGILRKYRG